MIAAPIVSEKVDRDARFVGGQLAGDDLLHHRPVLDDERVVETPFRFDALDQDGRRVLAGQGLRRVLLRQDHEDDEDDHRDGEEDPDHRRQASDDEAGH
jgi:hypothetical protein